MATSGGETADDDVWWPLAKLLARHRVLQESGESRKPAVLLTTGAMNPVHLGHVDMFARARRCLEQDHGYCVLAGYISPSNEGYVRPKCEHFKQMYLESDVRIGCVRRVVQESDWLECGAWEAAPAQGTAGSWPDYPVVVKALQSYLSAGPEGLDLDLRLGGHKCTVFYVCGLDHFNKCYLSSGLRAHRDLPDASTIEPRAGVVAIPRDDAPPARSELKRLVIGVTELNPVLSHLSSTKVRKLLSKNNKDRMSGGGGTEQQQEEQRAAIVQVVGGAVADFLLGSPAELEQCGEKGEGGGVPALEPALEPEPA